MPGLGPQSPEDSEKDDRRVFEVNQEDPVVAEKGDEEGDHSQRIAAVTPQEECSQRHKGELHEHEREAAAVNQVPHHDVPLPGLEVFHPDQGKNAVHKVQNEDPLGDAIEPLEVLAGANGQAPNSPVEVVKTMHGHPLG